MKDWLGTFSLITEYEGINAILSSAIFIAMGKVLKFRILVDVGKTTLKTIPFFILIDIILRITRFLV